MKSIIFFIGILCTLYGKEIVSDSFNQDQDLLYKNLRTFMKTFNKDLDGEWYEIEDLSDSSSSVLYLKHVVT